MESEEAFSITSAVPWKLNSTAHFLHSFCCRLKPASHMSERILCLQDLDGAAHPYRRRWQAEALKILASSPKAERWSNFCGYLWAVAAKEGALRRSRGWWDSNEVKCMTGKCVPVSRGVGVVQISAENDWCKNYRRSFTFWDKWPPF